MAKQITADGYEFVFSDDVVDAFVFDTPKYRVHSMKAVDIIAEFPNEYLFIELKKYDSIFGGIEFRCPLWGDKKLITNNCPLAIDDHKSVQASVKRISHDLRRKYCDTFLYRYSEDKLTKDVNYICVVEGCESAQTLRLNDIMKQTIPTGIPSSTLWKRPIVKNIAVVNASMWNARSKLKRYGSCSLSF